MAKAPIEFEYVDDESDDDEEEKEDTDEEASDEVEVNSEEYEEIEFAISEQEIDEWIAELKKLKKEKDSVNLHVGEDLVLKINYFDEDEEEEDDDEDEEEDED